MATHHAEGTFTVEKVTPVETEDDAIVTTALPTGVAVMTKVFDGDIRGRATTLFTAAFDPESGRGTYIAMESFTGTVQDVTGSFAFIHSASTTGRDRSNEYFVVVPDSGTDGFAGATGSGTMAIDADGTHRITLDITLP